MEIDLEEMHFAIHKSRLHMINGTHASLISFILHVLEDTLLSFFS